MTDEDEKTIISRVLCGEVNAYEELVLRNKAHVFKILSKHVPLTDVDEMSQVVFIQGYKSLASFRGDSPLKHWLTRIALRTCCDYWREGRKKSELLADPVQMRVFDTRDSLAKFKEDCSAEQAAEVLEQALSKLSADDRMVVTLHHLDGYSEKETASLLGWSITKVKFRAFRSRKALSQILQNIFPSSGLYERES